MPRHPCRSLPTRITLCCCIAFPSHPSPPSLVSPSDAVSSLASPAATATAAAAAPPAPSPAPNTHDTHNSGAPFAACSFPLCVKLHTQAEAAKL
uniref:Uncharacterized protein n=1 Tax=Physcomitrium patens TaxID=3218 RepID=A0A2K1JYL5_PHYPA|nr:hypothetical protein PHYPA_013729 [Physcomitrium patens]